jgi:sarcosine oxidase, subunit beta
VTSVAVIGGGIMGAAVLDALTARGIADVVLYEQTDRLASGSTRHSGGLVRVYHTAPTLADMAARSVPALKKLADGRCDELRYRPVGSIYFEPASRLDAARSELERLRKLTDWPIELLTPQEGQRRFPMFAWDPVSVAIYESEAGYASPALMTKFLANRAVARGAVVRLRAAVSEVVVESGSVRGILHDGRFAPADNVVVAAGAWSARLLSGVSAGLSLRSKRIHYITVSTRAGDHPAFIDDTTGLYGRPDDSGHSLVGLADDEWDVPLDSLAVNGSTCAKILAAARVRLPWMDGAVVGGGVRAFDGYAPDGLPLLGPSRDVPGLILATGWSGGGFKMALEAGRLVADAALPNLPGPR